MMANIKHRKQKAGRGPELKQPRLFVELQVMEEGDNGQGQGSEVTEPWFCDRLLIDLQCLKYGRMCKALLVG